jgi:Uma2 family endonuclease
MTLQQRIAPRLHSARFTVAEIYALQASGAIDDADNFELIEGEIVPMAAAKFNHHEWMKSALVRVFVLGTEKSTGVFVEPSVTLSENTLLEPDVAIWPRAIGTQDVRGTDILLVVEVAVSSIGYDLRVKAPLYAKAGVCEYWVVDAVRKTVRIHRNPVNGKYADVTEWESDDTVSPDQIPAINVRLADLE